jgi:hypothetical protein
MQKKTKKKTRKSLDDMKKIRTLDNMKDIIKFIDKIEKKILGLDDKMSKSNLADKPFIEETLTLLSLKLDELSEIELENGGGRGVRKEQLSRIESLSKKLNTINIPSKKTKKVSSSKLWVFGENVSQSISYINSVKTIKQIGDIINIIENGWKKLSRSLNMIKIHGLKMQLSSQKGIPAHPQEGERDREKRLSRKRELYEESLTLLSIKLDELSDKELKKGDRKQLLSKINRLSKLIDNSLKGIFVEITDESLEDITFEPIDLTGKVNVYEELFILRNALSSYKLSIKEIIDSIEARHSETNSNLNSIKTRNELFEIAMIKDLKDTKSENKNLLTKIETLEKQFKDLLNDFE